MEAKKRVRTQQKPKAEPDPKTDPKVTYEDVEALDLDIIRALRNDLLVESVEKRLTRQETMQLIIDKVNCDMRYRAWAAVLIMRTIV